jgi:hypothetical protein
VQQGEEASVARGESLVVPNRATGPLQASPKWGRRHETENGGTEMSEQEERQAPIGTQMPGEQRKGTGDTSEESEDEGSEDEEE